MNRCKKYHIEFNLYFAAWAIPWHWTIWNVSNRCRSVRYHSFYCKLYVLAGGAIVTCFVSSSINAPILMCGTILRSSVLSVCFHVLWICVSGFIHVTTRIWFGDFELLYATYRCNGWYSRKGTDFKPTLESWSTVLLNASLYQTCMHVCPLHVNCYNSVTSD